MCIEGTALPHHFLHPWSEQKSLRQLPRWQKIATIVVSLMLGAIIGYLGSSYTWYLGVVLGGVGAVTSFYLFSFGMKNCAVTKSNSEALSGDRLQDPSLNPHLIDPSRDAVILQKKILSEEKVHFSFHEKQALRLGLCGKHAINNAFGEEVESDEGVYIQKVSAYLKAHVNLDLNGVDPYDFGSDIAILQHILAEGPKKVKTKSAQISDIGSIEKYVGDAQWVIVANTKALAHFPSKGHAKHSIAAGHVFAGRKDEEGNWWFLDSRYDFQVDIPLNWLDRSFTVIVPTE